jgi:hypothetical protein
MQTNRPKDLIDQNPHPNAHDTQLSQTSQINRAVVPFLSLPPAQSITGGLPPRSKGIFVIFLRVM